MRDEQVDRLLGSTSGESEKQTTVKFTQNKNERNKRKPRRKKEFDLYDDVIMTHYDSL